MMYADMEGLLIAEMLLDYIVLHSGIRRISGKSGHTMLLVSVVQAGFPGLERLVPQTW